MDVCFVVDNTGSMGGAINNVKAAITAPAGIIAMINAASGGDFRTCLVTMDGTRFVPEVGFSCGLPGNNDCVIVNADLAPGDVVSVPLLALGLGFGGGGPESSNEALNTTVNGLDAAARAPTQQFGNFTEANYRAGAVKINIVITDAPGGGFDDIVDAGDAALVTAVSGAALANGIRISSVLVGAGFGGAAAQLMEYAATTGGVFTMVPSSGLGTADAIIDIIESCGTPGIDVSLDIHPTSCPNPVNCKSKGRTPMAINGSDTFDVTDIDVTTLTLVGPGGDELDSSFIVKAGLEDVSAPFEPLTGKQDETDCTTEGPDGFVDLTLKYKTQDVKSIVGVAEDGDVVVIPAPGAPGPQSPES